MLKGFLYFFITKCLAMKEDMVQHTFQTLPTTTLYHYLTFMDWCQNYLILNLRKNKVAGWLKGWRGCCACASFKYSNFSSNGFTQSG